MVSKLLFEYIEEGKVETEKFKFKTRMQLTLKELHTYVQMLRNLDAGRK